MSGYTKEQQVEDLSVINRSTAILSARIAGERWDESEAMLPHYVRISRYFAAEEDTKINNVVTQKRVAAMFREFVENKKISAFKVGEYEQLLRTVKARIRSMLQRRRKKLDTCDVPDVHVQPCYCGNFNRFKAKELGVEYGESL
jgi:hypothetical protein